MGIFKNIENAVTNVFNFIINIFIIFIIFIFFYCLIADSDALGEILPYLLLTLGGVLLIKLIINKL